MSTTTRRDLTQLPVQEQIRLLEELDRREKLEPGMRVAVIVATPSVHHAPLPSM